MLVADDGLGAVGRCWAVAFATEVGIGGNACVARERRVYGRHVVLLGC